MLTSELSQTHDDFQYEEMLTLVRTHFAESIQNGESLFQVNTVGLWDDYLGHLPGGTRQHNNCHACRKFIETYGGIVVIDAEGTQTSPLWDCFMGAGSMYGRALSAMSRHVSAARVYSIFYTPITIWGQPVTGEWHHLSVIPLSTLVFPREGLLTAEQAMAEKKEDFRILRETLIDAEWMTHVRPAFELLQSNALYRGDKATVMAEWIIRLSDSLFGCSSRQRHNLIWRAVASAPAGFCHIKSTVVGTLVDDIRKGYNLGSLAARFKEKMSPIQYQRPTAAPSAGQLAAAEDVMEQLKSAGALVRRYATLVDVRAHALWEARAFAPAPTPQKGKVFSHIAPKQAPFFQGSHGYAAAMNSGPITWTKFQQTILPAALEIQIQPPVHGPYAGLLTAQNLNAPPILQWDHLGFRNPVSHYLHHGGSPATAWGVTPTNWLDIPMLILQPNMWEHGRELPGQGKGVMFYIPYSHDSSVGIGNALFPEILKSEYHGIRSAIEVYARIATIHGNTRQSVCGLLLQASNLQWNLPVRVRTQLGWYTFTLERWD